MPSSRVSPELRTLPSVAPSVTREREQRSGGRAAAVVTGLLALMVLLGQMTLASAPARAEAPHSVNVTDTTGEVDPEILESRLVDVDFRRDVDLVVLVLDVTDYGFEQSQDTALNDAAVAYSRDAAPELLAADDDHWADGTVILALDPENRFLGTYAGEDVKLDDSGFESVQDAMRDKADDGEWEESLEDGAEKYADLLDRPWWQHPGVLIAGLVVVGGLAVGALSALGLRRAARRRVDDALPRFEGVLAKHRLTAAAASTLPVESPYAEAALSDYRTYLEKIDEATQLRARIPAGNDRPWGWGLKGRQREQAREFESTVTYLDDTDDDIIATNDLLHRLGGWRAAWDRELQPLQDSIDALDSALDDGEDISAEETAAVADLLELSSDISAEMGELTTKLEADEIDPDSALERLDTLTTELSASVASLQSLRISRLAEDDDEAEVMRDASWDADLEHEERGYRSVRGRCHAMDAAISGNPTDIWHLSPLVWYSAWQHESNSDLESHRNPSSSSGSTSGYSAASGGFSGAGSSSRF
ncbi:DUF5129 domain-containing protein [Brachybacterium alimentarium]|uniref:DUF5129 domain-containing protein n=1 Tax=Brachybacterium alimentarium TaxID=47845 RepID=UPI003FD1771C